MMNPTPRQATAGARQRGLLIIWCAQFTALGLFFALTRLVDVPVRAGNDNLRWLFGVLGGATFALSFMLKRILMQRAVEQQRPDYVSTAYVLAFALCEAAAIFALVNYFISGVPLYLLFILAAVGLLFHFPRRAHFEAVPADGAQPGSQSTLR